MKKSNFLIFLTTILLFGICLSPMLAKASPAQKLNFFAVEVIAQPPEYTPEITGIVIHFRDYHDIHSLTGFIEGESISGYTESFFHVIDNQNGKVVCNGDSYMYLTWGDLEGYFYGKKVIEVIDGVLTGRYSLQGFGDFDGMKLIGIIYGNIIVNTFEATLLIPN